VNKTGGGWGRGVGGKRGRSREQGGKREREDEGKGRRRGKEINKAFAINTTNINSF